MDALRKDALLYALQNQINPHYMYNVFEIIRSIALIHGVNEIEIIAVNLSDVLRYNLNENIAVTVVDEYELIKKYLVIMKVKYNSSFHVKFDLAEDVLKTPVIKMIFQPIVENSFNHGYIKRKHGFKLTISGEINDGILTLVFYDNGRGISEEDKNKIFHSFSDKEYSRSKNIGLSNLNYRLNMYYGEKNYELIVESKMMEYTKIIIKIKLI